MAFYQLERILQDEANADRDDGGGDGKTSKSTSYSCDCPDSGGLSLTCPVHGPHSAG